MVTGEPGANGPRVQGPAEAVPCQGDDHALIQPLEMAAVRVEDPLLNRNLVTPRHAKVTKPAYLSDCFSISLSLSDNGNVVVNIFFDSFHPSWQDPVKERAKKTDFRRETTVEISLYYTT